VIVAADRAQSIDRRGAGRARRVGIGCATRGSVPEFESELGRDPDRELGEPSAPFLLLHGPVPAVAVHLDLQIGDHRVGADAGDLGFGRLERFQFRRTQVDLQRASLRHHVGACATPRDTYVHRDAWPAPVEALQRDDRVGGLEQRVATLLRFHAGVGRAPDDVDRVVGDALACAHDVAVRPRPFQDERRIELRRHRLDDRPAERRSDLFVGVADVGDAIEPVEAGSLQHFHREEAGQQPALHVGHARPARDVSVDRERSRRSGAVVEHRVHVSHQQDPGSAGTVEGADQEVA